jgi:O-antigen/teichoic acid export membrane protein
MLARLQTSQALRLLRSGVLAQAVLSLGSLGVSLLLIRHAADADFGRFVLVQAGLMLLVSLQGAMLGGPVAVLAPAREPKARATMFATVFRDSRRWTNRALGLAMIGLALAAIMGISGAWLLVLVPTLAAAYLSLRRELVRGFTHATLRQQELPPSDVLYVAVLLVMTVAGIYLTRYPVPVAVLGLALASAAAARPLVRSLQRDPGLSAASEPEVWQEIRPLALWASVGAVIFWLFSHAYNYLLALQLSVAAVAVVATTRLLLMPVNLLATSLNSLLLPLASTWNQNGGMARMLPRLLMLAAAAAAIGLGYCLVLWLLRDFIAAEILNKEIPHYEHLLRLWMLCIVLALVRNVLQTGLMVQRRFRFMAALSFCGVVISAAVMTPALKAHGAPGAVMGLICAEGFYLIAVLLAIGRQFVGPFKYPPPDAGGTSAPASSTTL